MDAYVIVLRIVHIVAGVFWVGGAAVFTFFVEPSAKALGQPAGGQFMGHIAQKKKLPLFFAASGILTVVAGILLYIRDSGGFDPDWITSGVGLTLTVGGLAGIGALVLGVFFARPTVQRIGALGAQIQEAGGPPSEAQAAEMHALDARYQKLGWAIISLLALAVVAMAIARYL